MRISKRNIIIAALVLGIAIFYAVFLVSKRTTIAVDPSTTVHEDIDNSIK